MTAALRLTGDAWQADPGIDPAVKHFVVAAKEFCRLLESNAALPPQDLFQQLLIAALALYSAGLACLEVDPELDTRSEPFFDEHSRQMLRKQPAERLGSNVPYPENHDPAILAGDLAGLYVEVKEGLLSVPEHAGRVTALKTTGLLAGMFRLWRPGSTARFHCFCGRAFSRRQRARAPAR